MTQLRFALAQIDTCVGALDANAAKVLDYSRKAAAGNAQAELRASIASRRLR